MRGILSAYGWCFRHAAWIRARRHEVQSRRRVHDTAIMALMSHKVLDREGGIAGIVNGLSRVYARVVGLRFHD